ncbi:hypothetical protein GOP47_0026926 [Adiantum capillus-veneris]|nr:hypothetical protein GOP47_0026926 [Adiantum capillus-veneris]
MRNEENDLKLHKGFNIKLDANLSHNHQLVGIPQGLHRCLFLTAALNVPKLVSRRNSKTDTPANLHAWISSQAINFSLDCHQLDDKDFLLLLKVLDKQEYLQNYSQTEKLWKSKLSEVDKKLQQLDSIMKDKKMKLLSEFHSAMERMLLTKYPWEESLFSNADRSQTTSQPILEGTSGDASSQPSRDSHLKHEAKLCCLWSDQNDPEQRFLYPGSLVEMAHVEKDGGIESGLVFSIEVLHTQHKTVGGPLYTDKSFTPTGKDTSESHKMGGGPICFGQHFVLTVKDSESHAGSMQQCIAYFSHLDGVALSNHEPVILNGDTKLILNLSITNESELVVVRHAGGGDTGLLTWLTAFCNESMSLYRNAAAISHVISNTDSKALNDKVLEKCLKEPLRKWPEMKCLPSEAGSIMLEFLSEKQDEKISI